MPPLAEAWVRIRPDTSTFKEETVKGVDGAAPALKKSGDRHGKTFGSAFVKSTAGPLRGIAGVVGPQVAAAFAVIGGAKLFAGFISEGREAQKTGAQTAAVIKSTGGAAKVSANQVGALATSISNKVGVDDEAIQSGANLLLTFTGIRNEAGKGNKIFDQATQTVTDMAAAMNNGEVTTSGLKTASIQVGKALNDPVKGMTALAKVGVTFTKGQKDQIAALVKNHDTLGAQKIILGELNKEFGGSAAAGTNAMEKLKVVFGNIQEQVGTALLPVIDGFASWLSRVLPGAVSVAVSVIGKIGGGIKALIDLVGKGDITAAFRKAFHVEEDSGLVTFLLKIHDVGVSVVTWIRGTGVDGIKALWAAFREGDVTSDGFVGVMERIGVGIRAFAGFITGTVIPALVRFAQWIGPILGRAFVAIGHWIMGTAVPALRQFGGFIVNTVIPGAVKLWGFLSKNLGPTFVALGQFITQHVWPALQGLFTRFQQVWPTISKVLVFVGKLIAILIGLAVIILGKVLPIIIRLAGPIFTLLFAAIGRVIGIIAGLVRVAVAAFTAIWTAGKFMWEHVLKPTFDALVTAFKFTARMFGVLRDSLATAWGHIKSAALSAIRFVVDTFLGMVGTIINGAARAFGWVPGLGGKLKEAAAKFNKFRDDTNAALGGVKSRKVTVTATLTASAGPIRGGAAFAAATGGPIKGPGTSTSDSIPGWLSNNEHVWTAREVAGAGGHRQVAVMRKMAAAGKLGYAAGGPVRFDVTPQLAGMPAFRSGIASFNARTDAAARKLVPQVSSAFGGGGSVARWLPVVLQVLALLGRPSSEAGANLRRIAFESGGNPFAINLTDSNARAGHPSQGLMQTIPGTFAAFAGPYISRGINDAFANIYAGDNYAIHRYGSIAAIDPLVRPRGYDNGGPLMPGRTVVDNRTGRPEQVRTADSEDRLERALLRIERALGGLAVDTGREVHRNLAKGSRA